MKAASILEIVNPGSSGMWRRLGLAFVLFCLATQVGAQTSDSFNPGANGAVNTLTLQADGRILVGGAFTWLGGLPRGYLGRLNGDGSIDSAFAPNASDTVNSLMVQADGRILVAGAFISLGGQSRNHIARLDTNGVVEAAFNPNASGTVNCLAVQSNGQILVGGLFNTLGGKSIPNLGRLNTNGTVDTNFTPLVLGTVNAIVVQTNGQILIGGNFGSVGGVNWRHLARLHADGSLDTNYVSVNSGLSVSTLALQPNGQLLVGGTFGAIGNQPCNNLGRLNENGTMDSSFAPGANSTVNALAIQADGRILVGGKFTILGGQTRTYIGRLDSTGAVDDSLNPSANNYVNSLLPQAGGKTLVGGIFTVIGGQPRNNISQLEADGTTSFSFSPNPNGVPYAIATQVDGKLLVGGPFTSLSGQARSRIARFNPDGTLDATFNPGASGRASLSIGNAVYCFALQTNGQILVGGDFTNLAGAFRYSLGRINPDGSLDPNFNCTVGGNYPAVHSLLIQTNGQILVGGTFSSIGGQTRTGLARLNPNGTVDVTFNPVLTYASGIPTARSLALQADGKIVIGGSFTGLAGQSRTNLGRLDVSGSLDPSFLPPFNSAFSSVSAVLLQPDGKILVGGGFGFNGRLHPDGSADTNFTLTTDATISAMSLQTDGKILVSGNFSRVNSVSNNCLVRINTDGSLDTNFNAGMPAPSFPTYAAIAALALQADGSIIVGGTFSSVGGQARTNLGRLSNTSPATQNLSADDTTVVWLRGGTSPEVWRTWFESSTDGVSWTSLGAGTRTNGGWRLTGLSLSAANLLRAQGSTSGGQFNGSGAMVASLLAPLSILVNDGAFGLNSNQFGFNVRGTSGRSVIYEATTNLVDWTEVKTNVLGTAPLYFSQPHSSDLPQLFFRVRYQ